MLRHRRKRQRRRERRECDCFRHGCRGHLRHQSAPARLVHKDHPGRT
jgi:hypothetical protein